MANRNRRRVMLSILAGVAALAMGAGAWGYAAHRKAAKAAQVVQAEDPANAWNKLRETMRRQDLSEEERRKAFEEARRAMEARMQRELNDYFAARTDGEKKAVLDRGIDEMQKR